MTNRKFNTMSLRQSIQYVLLFAGVLILAQCAPKVGDQVSAPPTTEPKAPPSFRAMAPEPGPARKIEIGTYETFTLDNGLRVIVVENHKIPRITYRLYVDRDPSLEGDVAGMTSLMGQMLSRGTTTRTKAQIDESIDFVGGSMSTTDQGGFASSLTRHNETVLAIFSDVILNPSFPEEEFEKLKKQTISGLQTQKDDPNAISGNVSGALLYGKDHPYGEIVTEVTVGNITLDDCKTFYDQYFKPNISYLVVVGDITPQQAKTQAMKYFGSWGKGDVDGMTYKMPQAPETTKVSFVDKAGAVQSVINIAYPVDLKPNSPDVIPSRVMNTILGSGFSGRLFRNLREDKGYTYGAYSSLNNDEVVGSFSASASVRNEVTDSAVAEFLFELEKLRTEEVTDSELELAKNYIAGAFARSLESPQTVANFALNTKLYNLPEDYYATYLERLEKVTKADVMTMAQKYIRPGQAHIIVVGNQDAVSEKLARFDTQDGKVTFYDIYANEKAAVDASKIAVTGDEVIAKYLTALGGVDKLKGVTALSTDAAMEVQGMQMAVSEKKMAPSKYHMSMSMNGMAMMKQVYNGESGYIEQQGQRQALEGEMLEQIGKEARIFPEIQYTGDAYSIEVKGIEEVNGEEAYKVLVTDSESTTTEYYSTETGFKLRSIATNGSGDQSQTITTDFKDYREVNGIFFPHTMTISGMMPIPLEMKITKVEVNPTIEASLFDF